MHHEPQKPEISAEEIAVVFLGDFNPKIYQPAWFAHEDLIRASEADNAKVEMVHSDFTSFSTDWFVLQVGRERFQASVRSLAYRTHLRDLILGTFHKLSHTPLYQMGINFSVRLRFKSEEDWHAFGHFVLPKTVWRGFLKKPGLRAVSVEGLRSDGIPGHVLVSAEPIRGSRSEAFLRINDHSEVRAENAPPSAKFFLELIERDFDESINRSAGLVAGLLDRFAQTTEFEGEE